MFAVLVLTAGCGEPPAITQYESDAVEPRTRPVSVGEVEATLDRMLAAIVPAGDQAWFFKLTARSDDAKKLRQPFRDLLATVSVAPGDKKPTWKLPEGWLEKPGDAMRAATIEIPLAEGVAELTVSALPYDGQWTEYVERNVARWLGQLQQAPLPSEVVKKLAQSTPTRGDPATMFELVGVLAPSGGGMPAGHPPIAQAGAPPPADDPAADGSSLASSPSTASPSNPPSTSPGWKYELPAGWSEAPPRPMRVATFAAGEGDSQVEIAVTQFPAVPGMIDPVGNAERWAGLAGASPDAAEVKSAIKPRKISDLDGHYVEFFGPAEAATAQGLAAGMVRRGETMWFFKLTGPRAAVDSQRDAFGKFLDSVRFSE